jgi:hypothetical protein
MANTDNLLVISENFDKNVAEMQTNLSNLESMGQNKEAKIEELQKQFALCASILENLTLGKQLFQTEYKAAKKEHLPIPQVYKEVYKKIQKLEKTSEKMLLIAKKQILLHN